MPMTSRPWLALAALGLACAAPRAHAQTSLYTYNFNDASTTGTGAANIANLFSVDATAPGKTGGSVMTSNFDPSTIVSFTGYAGGTGNAALALQEGVAGSAAANAGKYLQFTANLAGYQGITIGLDTQRTGTGFDTDLLQYSLDGTNFTTFTTYTPALSTITPSYTSATPAPDYLQSFDLSSISGLNNNANAAFRIVFNNSTAVSPTSAGNNRLDNLIISGRASGGGTPPPASAVPEPGTYALLLLGGLALVPAVRRRRAA